MNRKYGLLLFCALLVCLFSTVGGQSSAFAGTKIGTMRIDITPWNNGFPTMWIAGYSIVSRPNPLATGVTRNLYARALAIQDANGTKVLVTADILGFPPSLSQQIRSGVVTQFGLADKDLMLVASHTHWGPALPEKLDPYITYNLSPSQVTIVTSYGNWLAGRIVNLIGQVINQLPSSGDVLFSYGVGSQNFGVNRIIQSGPQDNEVPVLAVKSKKGKLWAVVFTYACHAITNALGPNTYHSDYPGVAADQLEAAYPGAIAFFVTGAGGDIDPNINGPDDAGTRLKQSVNSVLQGGLQAVDGPITTQYQRIVLPMDLSSDPRTLYQLIINGTISFPFNTPQGSQYRHATRMMDQINAGTLPTSIPLPIQVWTFQSVTTSPVVLIALGGEPLVSYSLNFKQQFATGRRVWVAGYGNDQPGYIPTEAVLQNEGYEAGWTSEYGTKAGDGSMLYYNWPARFLPGLEAVITSTVSNMVNGTGGATYNSLSLNGLGAYVNVPISGSLNITGSITVEAWIKTNSNTAQQGIIERYKTLGPGTFDGGYALRLSGGKLQFWVLRNGYEGDFVESLTSFSNTGWYHVAGVFDNATQQLRVYINGSLDRIKFNVMFTPGTGTGTTRVGARGDDATDSFNGLIDEARVSAAALYTSNFPTQPHLTVATGTKGLWKFDDRTANDTSGNANHGSLLNGADFSTVVP